MIKISDLAYMEKIKNFFIESNRKVVAFLKQLFCRKNQSRGLLFRLLTSIIAIVLEIGLLSMLTIVTLSGAVVSDSKDRLISIEEAATLSNVDCILVLGAGLRLDGTPSDMLADRISVGVDLFNRGVSSRLLMSGDHTTKEHDEVDAMKKYAIEQGIPSEMIFKDHAGVCTYDSVYRAKYIFGAKKIVIVTQEYHLYRALYIAEQIGIEAYGVSATKRTYSRQGYRDIREIAARAKDFFLSLVDASPRYLGNRIPLSGNGDET